MSALDTCEGVVAAMDGPVLRLRLDRPKTRNALTPEMMDALIEHLERAGQDEAVRAIVLSGSGGDFCSGSDLVVRNQPRAERPRVGSIQRRVATQAHRLIPAILTTQVPVVAVVQGYAAGIGFHLAIAADFCVAASSATFWEPFLDRGFTPDSGGTWLLPRLAGVARARRLLLLGEKLSGSEAARWGLIHEAVAEDALEESADMLVQRLASGPTVAGGLTKWLINTGGSTDLTHHLSNEAFALELALRSEDFREGLAAFREHRPPEFRGR